MAVELLFYSETIAQQPYFFALFPHMMEKKVAEICIVQLHKNLRI